MPYSTCCDALNFPENNICRILLQDCQWIEEQDMEADVHTENQINQEQINKNEKNGE